MFLHQEISLIGYCMVASDWTINPTHAAGLSPAKKSERSLFWVSPETVSLWARYGLVSFWAGLGPFPSRLDLA